MGLESLVLKLATEEALQPGRLIQTIAISTPELHHCPDPSIAGRAIKPPPLRDPNAMNP